MREVSSAKLTANPAALGRAWVQVYELEEAARAPARGKLFVVLSLNREFADQETLVDSVIVGREAIAKLQKEYFGNLAGGAFAVLQRAVEGVAKDYSSLSTGLQIIVAATLGDVVYTAISGGGQVSLLRGGSLVKILTGLPGKVATASGYPRPRDMLLLATGQFHELFSEGLVRAALTQGGTPRGAVEQLAPRLHSEEAPNAGCVVLGFDTPSREEAATVFKFDEPTPPAFVQTSPASMFLGKLGEAFGRRIPQRKIYVHPGADESGGQNRRTAYTVGLLLLILLAISIVFGVRQKRQRDYREQYATRLATARHNFDEAQSLVALNPTRARELFIESSRLAQELSDQEIKDPALDELKRLLSESEGKILGEYRANLDLFIDLSLVSEGFSGKDLAASGENVFVLDGAGKVIRVILGSKKSQVVAGPQEAGSTSQIAAYSDRGFLVKEDGIYEIGEEGAKVVKDWAGGVLAYAYTGNLYVLEKEKSVIKRYSGGSSGFGKGAGWLGTGIAIDLTNSVDWTIDGSVWIVSSTGKITRLTQGVPQSFSPDPVSPQLVPTAVYTNEDLKGLYILDAKNSRIVVFDKEGRLLGQYKNEGLASAVDLVVSEEMKKAIILSGGKLQSIQLRHIE